VAAAEQNNGNNIDVNICGKMQTKDQRSNKF